MAMKMKMTTVIVMSRTIIWKPMEDSVPTRFLTIVLLNDFKENNKTSTHMLRDDSHLLLKCFQGPQVID